MTFSLNCLVRSRPCTRGCSTALYRPTAAVRLCSRLPLQGLLLWRREQKPASRILQVKAPPGIAPGQTFFVPLVAPPTVRVGGRAAAAAAPPSKPKVA